jgi:hypothetical protein
MIEDMVFLLGSGLVHRRGENTLQGRVHLAPFGQQTGEDVLADRREAVKPLVSFFFFSPLTDQ